jgi:hypothetical protein
MVLFQFQHKETSRPRTDIRNKQVQLVVLVPLFLKADMRCFSVANVLSPSPKNRDVFLGGACNPTTWRKDTAIPLLDALGKTYYNPQVDEWHDGLMAEELHHKNTCSVLLFVIDRNTRGVASIAEAAYYIGAGRDVILVLQPYPETVETLNESKDLNRGRAYLREMAESHGVCIFDTVQDAIHGSHLLKKM